MRLGVVRRIDKGDIARSGETPKWIDALLNPLNTFIESVVSALDRRLTFENNFLCVVSSYEITSGTDLEVNPTPSGASRLRVTGVIPLSVSEGQVNTFGWVQLTNGNISISATLVNATTANLKILILLG